MLTVRLLGEVDLRLGRERVPGLDSPRLKSLLAYLLLHRHAPQARSRLAFLHWPDSTEAQARTNLRQLLHHLRRALPDADRLLEITPGTVQWRLQAPVHLDVADFEQTAAEAAGAVTEAERRAALEQAAAAYGGELLPGSYEEWILLERERLRQRNVEVLEELASGLEDTGEYASAIRYGEMLLRCDPVHEATYRRLMRLHSRSGERARALRVFHTCSTVLERELGVEPGPHTRELYAELLRLEPAGEGLGASGAPTFAAAPLIGRHAEWQRAVGAWHDATAGRAQLLVVTGEAGLGKTRLVEELERWCARQGVATARTRAYAAEGRLAYAPVADWLRSETLRPGLAKLEPIWLSEITRLLPELLSDHPDLRRPEPLSAGEQRQRLFEALARGALRGAHPLLLVIDDLQWCDQETLEFLHYLVRFDPGAPLLVAATVRSDEIGPQHGATALLAGLGGLEKLVEISLVPLDPADVSALGEQLSEKPLPPEAAERLYRETEGIPLFVVETVRAGLLVAPQEGPVGTATPPAQPGPSRLPPKVRSAIQGRLSRLSPEAGQLVSVAATVGREFSSEVLAAASGLAEDTVVAGLDELWRRRIIREHGLHAYDFSHDKIREVAYGEVGPARRRQLHLAVAGALGALHARDLGPVSGRLAAHYDQAGRPEPAVLHYQQAAAVAQGVFASQEVVPLLTRGLGLLEQLPSGVARDDQELAMREALGVALVALQGYNSPATTENYTRADELCLQLGRSSSPPVLRGLALAAIESCKFDRAIELGERLLDLGRDGGEIYLEVEGRYLLGVTSFWNGNLAASRHHLEAAVATYRPEDHRLHVSRFAQDPKVICLCRLALTLWYLGCAAESAAAIEESLTLAEQLGHPMSHAYALSFASWLAGERGDLDATEQHAQGLETVSLEHGFVRWAPLGRIWLAWTEARRGKPKAGVERLLTGFQQMAEGGMHTDRSYFLLLLAQAEALAGHPAAAEEAITEALEQTARTGPLYLEAELHRVRAELLLASGANDGDAITEVEAALRKALAVSRQQGARLFELRAATSLTRWRTATGSPEQAAKARAILEQVLGSFPDTFGTSDLDEARQLLRPSTAWTGSTDKR